MKKLEQQLEAALEKQLQQARTLSIDPSDLSSRPSLKQEAVIKDVDSLHIYVVAGNQSGKTQLAARVTAWKFEETHPYWNRRPEWGDEPLLLIVAGRVSDQLNEIWRSKLKPMLEPGSYSEHYSQRVIKEVINKNNNNKILFTSHDKAEQAKDKVQSFVAHDFWLDEMPSHASYMEEAQRRVDAKRGQFRATFTPKSRNEDIRHTVDHADPSIASVYRMGKLDNPIYAGREEEEWAKINHLPKKIQHNIMFGDWLDGDDAVFAFKKEEHTAPLPSTYSTVWPHVIAYDPASSSDSGLTLFAFDQSAGQWWVVDSTYIKHSSPSEHIEWLEKYTAPYNIVRRTCDNEPWFYNEYAKQTGKAWLPVAEKTQRKKELIAKLQDALVHHAVKIKAGLKDLEREFSTAEWKPGFEGEKIKNSQKFHLIDSLQYGLDVLPKIEKTEIKDYHVRLREAAEATEALKVAVSKSKDNRSRARVRRTFNKNRRKNGWFF